MAFNNVKFKQFLIKVGDGATPEVFTPLCTVNASKGLKFGAKIEESSLPDCDDLDAIAWTTSEVSELSAELSGEGVLELDNDAALFAWFSSGGSKNVKISMQAGVKVVTYTGAFIMDSLEYKADKAQSVSASVSFKANGKVDRAQT